MDPLPLQEGPGVPDAGGPLAFLGTLLLAWLFFSFTAQVAATYLLGDVPWRRALVVGSVPAVASAALIRYPPGVVLAVAVAADFVAVHVVYRVRYRTAGLVTVGHVVAAISLGVPLAYLATLLSTAPG
jgi:hypothetical protein